MADEELKSATAEDEMNTPTREENKGAVAWMARNSVAANIVMFFLIVAGLFKMCSVKKEVFPEFELDILVVNIPYPSASPSEVEQGVLLAAEEAIRTIDGIKEVRGTATEGFGVLVVELLLGTDGDQALDKVKSALDRVTSFPDPVKAEGAIAVFKASNRQEVISLVLYGDIEEESLRFFAERTRDELLQDKRITYAEINGIRPLEIAVEVSQEKLREIGLTNQEVAGLIRAASIELPGGEIKTAGGDLLIRTTERRDRGEEFAEIILISRPDGTTVKLGDIADIKDAFAEVDKTATFNGKRAAMVRVFRTGDQGPVDVSAVVHDYIEKNKARFPEGVSLATWFDQSEFYSGRIDLLKRNAILGLLLVLIVLSLFLEIKLAFWVTLGIPITFVGAFIFLPSADVSINMISLFAFIVVLGMVVDDAIIVGEAVYKQRQDGYGPLRAAIRGAKEVATPVTFAIITTIFAFMPMLFVPGPVGKFFRVIPIVVISVFILSLFESLFILPAHLAHSKPSRKTGFFGPVHRVQGWFARQLERFVLKAYEPFLRKVLAYKGLTLAVAAAVFIGSVGMCTGGRIKTTFLPQVDSDIAMAQADLPFGTAIERSEEMLNLMIETARETLAEFGTEEELSRGLFARIGGQTAGGPGNPSGGGGGGGGAHLLEVSIYFVDSDSRPMKSSEFSRRWRAKIEARATGLEALRFRFSTGPSGGKAVYVELSHKDQQLLADASVWLADKVKEQQGTYDVDDGFALGKQQLDITLTPEARSLGLNERELALQLRSTFFGAEAVRQQRGREEVRVYVRRPRNERDSEYHLENLMLRTPAGGEIPLSDATVVSRGRAFTEIQRIDGRRIQAVTAEVDRALGNAADINTKLADEVLPEFRRRFPGVSASFGGEQREQGDVNKSLVGGFLIAVVGMFALLAISFRSYAQPLVVLIAIPFGFVGALWGHLALGFSWSMMSLMGLVALSGIVINDSLILVVAINKYYRDEGMPLLDAVVAGGVRRFRPILLTSLTTFFGLAPMILETSVQARFLIPMAVSLGFGVILATFVTLLVVPSAYLALHHWGGGFVNAWKEVLGGSKPDHTSPPDDEPTRHDPLAD